MMRLLAVARKEFRQLRRDRITFSFMVVVPLIQILLFGYAANTDVRHIRTVVMDHDQSSQSRDLVRSLEATGMYDVIGSVTRYDEIETLFRRGEARAAFVVADDFASNVRRGRTANLQLIVDGSDPQIVSIATCTAGSLVSARMGETLLGRLRSSVGAVSPPFAVEPLVWYNGELRNSTYVVPGIIGLILSLTMVMLTSMAIARERERGTLEQLMVSPVRRGELIVGKIAPYVLIGYVQMSVVLVAGRLIFDVPIVGSLWLLYGLAFAFITASLALGMLLSTFARTQQQAVQISLLFLLPNVMLSGFLYPTEAMPEPARWLSQALPFTHFLRIVRGILLRGSQLAQLQSELTWLCAILLGAVMLASLRFRKRLA